MSTNSYTRLLHSPDTVPYRQLVSRSDRATITGHSSFVLWFTGLSGSGKSTLAHLIERQLFERGCHTYTFDGDNVRHGLCGDLDFSPEDRTENIRRIGEMVGLFTDAGIICLTAFISPLRADRDRVRAIVGAENFIEVFVSCPIEVCEARDVKGLYKKARAGLIPNYTGISAPYEEPLAPEILLETAAFTPQECVDVVLAVITDRLLSVNKQP